MKRWSLRRLSEGLNTWITLSIILAVIAAIIMISGNHKLRLIGTNFLILTALVIALQVFIGNSGIISFGNLAFFAVGAYSTALLTIPPDIKVVALKSLPPIIQNLHVGFLPAVFGGALIASLVAVVTGMVFTRMPDNAMAMATLALLVIVHTTIVNWDAVTRGTIGIYGIPSNSTMLNVLLCLMAVIVLALLFKASPIGLRLLAIRENKLAATTIGIHVENTKLFSWILSGFLMGAGGALWAQNVVAFGPDSFFFRDTFNMLAMLIIGGQASVSGAVVGCLIVTVISELLRPIEAGLVLGTMHLPRLDGFVPFAIAILILLVLIYRPSGILGSHEIVVPIKHWLTKKKRKLDNESIKS
jgi:branched-chain amino acid transport system permease protein